MSCELPPTDRLAPRQRPAGRAIGYQRWSQLLFVHWRVPVEVLRPLVPAELTVETWEGDAWLGLVAFHMSGVRPWWSPPIPGVSAFHETNLRTYVHLDGQGPGVWFLSLEAASSLAVHVARWRWRLPYFRSEMSLCHEGSLAEYTSRRLWPKPREAQTDLAAEVGDALTEPGADTLEFFLAERYLLYTDSPERGLLCGQVHHRPYPLRTAQLVRCRETLTRAAGVAVNEPPCHVMFSDGVEVEIFPLARALGQFSCNPRARA